MRRGERKACAVNAAVASARRRNVSTRPSPALAPRRRARCAGRSRASRAMPRLRSRQTRDGGRCSREPRGSAARLHGHAPTSRRPRRRRRATRRAARPLERGARDQHRAAACALGLVRRRLLGQGRVAVSRMASLVAAPRVVARARVPDATSRGIEDLRARGADTPGRGGLDERLEEPRLDRRVVVEKEDVRRPRPRAPLRRPRRRHRRNRGSRPGGAAGRPGTPRRPPPARRRSSRCRRRRSRARDT